MELALELINQANDLICLANNCHCKTEKKKLLDQARTLEELAEQEEIIEN